MSTYWNDRCRLVKLNKNDGLNWFLSFDFESHLMCSPRFVFLGVSTSVSELVTQHWQNRQRSAHIFPFVPLLLLRLAWVCVCVCARVCYSQCVHLSVHSHTSDLSHQWQVICLSGGDDLMRQAAAFLVCSCRLYPRELLVNDTCGGRPENCTHSMFLKCCFRLITTLLHVQNKRWQATVITMKERFFFLFSAIRACKNITSCWTGVCFPAKRFTTRGCHTRSVKGEYPPTTGFLLRPLWWLSVSQPAHQPALPSGQNRQSTSQSVTQPEIKPVDQLVSRSGESVTARGGLAHTARSVMKKEDVHHSQVRSHSSLQLLDCSHGGDSSMLVRARFRV